MCGALIVVQGGVIHIGGIMIINIGRTRRNFCSFRSHVNITKEKINIGLYKAV